MSRLDTNDLSRDALVKILPTCGGTCNPALIKVAELLKTTEADDLYEALGSLSFIIDSEDEELSAFSVITEIARYARESQSGELGLREVLEYFSRIEHTDKFKHEKSFVARELDESVIPFAHTLMPLSQVGGKYVYDNGDASVAIEGLIQLGNLSGTPYAHLAGLICIEDEGLSAQILADQRASGFSDEFAHLVSIDYKKAHRLRTATLDAARKLGLSR